MNYPAAACAGQSRRQGRSDPPYGRTGVGVLQHVEETDDEANEDSALI